MADVLIDDQTLEELRAIELSAMPDTCTIIGLEKGYDERGEPSTTTTVRAEDEPCRFRTLGGNELLAAQQQAAEANAEVTLRALTEVLGTDEITVTTSAGEVFTCEVQFVPRQAFETARPVLVKILNWS
jgi:hypothetical protein